MANSCLSAHIMPRSTYSLSFSPSKASPSGLPLSFRQHIFGHTSPHHRSLHTNLTDAPRISECRLTILKASRASNFCISLPAVAGTCTWTLVLHLLPDDVPRLCRRTVSRTATLKLRFDFHEPHTHLGVQHFVGESRLGRTELLTNTTTLLCVQL